MDAINQKILRELDKNVRISFTQLGKNTGVSKEVAQYRVKQLEKKEIITGYWAIPKIGRQNHVYKLILKNKSLGSSKKQEFIDFAVGEKAVSWLASTEGNWDFVISSFVSDDEEFSMFVIKLMQKFGKYIKEKHITKATSMISMNEKYLQPKNELLRNVEDSFLEPEPITDEIDKKIIILLSKNARITFSEMGRQLQLTPEAIGVRYRKIWSKGLIVGMNPRINHSKIGLSYYHIFIAVTNYEKKDAIANFYTLHPNCVFIMKHIGYYDLHLEIICNQNEIESIIEQLSEKFGEDIASYDLLNIRKEHIMIVKR